MAAAALAQQPVQKAPPKFKERVYVPRESLLSQQWEGGAVVFHNFFASAFILCAAGTAIFDAIEHGNPLHHLWLVHWNFHQFLLTMTIWSAMYLSTVVCGFNGLKLWALLPAKSVTARNQWPFVALYAAYLAALFYYPLTLIYHYDLNCACSFIITCENTRLIMKVHSFVRENLHKAVKHKERLAEEGLSLGNLPECLAAAAKLDYPTLQQYVYFTFAPAFIYKNEYPRTERTDWRTVARYLGQCLLVVYVVSLMFINFIRPRFVALDYARITYAQLFYQTFPSIIPGAVCLMMLFYGLIHSWQNMFAEALRFADREFYMNWWTSKNMADYYRDWNLVVHDWLYSYIYKDLTMLFAGDRRARKAAQAAVFFLSAAFHEYWFGVSLRLFYPIMFNLYFVCGGVFFVVSRLLTSPGLWNLLMWFNLLIGTGLFVACYASEWYARQRCEPYFAHWLVDLVVPRAWTCGL